MSQATTLRAVVFAVLVALLGACSSVEPAGTGAVDTSTTTTEAGEAVATVPDTSVTVPEPTVDDVLSDQLARISVPESLGAAMVALVDGDGSVNYASKGSDWGGAPLTPDAAFRIGSVTKTFTAVLVLMLVDEGVIDLDAEAAEYVARVEVPEGVTVTDLLQHTSGIPNYTVGPSNPLLTFQDDPERAWSPEELVALVEDRGVSQPGTAFSYSNTNYAILGILIEEVTGMPFATALRERILDPLTLDATYPDADEVGEEPFGAYTGITGSNEPTDFPYTAIATSAWASGDLVSSVDDLHAFFSALFDERLISAELIATMTARRDYGANPEYGLGIYQYPIGDLYGHDGGIPGYITSVLHSPDTGQTAIVVATNDTTSFDPSLVALAANLFG